MERRTGTRSRSYILGTAGFLLLLALDQLTKYAAYTYLRGNWPIVLFPGVFELHYLENTGAAFGMMEDQQWFFIAVAATITLALGWFYHILPQHHRFTPLRILCTMISAGAVGNMIDRLIHRFVIDFLYFKLIDFPVFNIADCYVVLGVIAAAVCILFVYQEEDWAQVFPKKARES